MTRGRKPDPGAEKRGTRKRKTSSRAPTSGLALPDELKPLTASPPDDISPEMALVWTAVMEDLGSRGANPSAYREVDVVLVRTLVDAIQCHHEATLEIREHGIVLTRPIMDATGEVVGHRREKNPAFGIQKDAAATILRLTDSLGLNPAARVRLGVMQLAGQSILASLQKMMKEAVE